jgi:hypothetical protein
MIEQMQHSLELGRKLIDTELDTGLLNFIVKPVIKAFYDYWAQNDARSGTLTQINLTLEAGKQLVLNGSDESAFKSVLDTAFPRYFKSDQITKQCNKHHKNFENLRKVSYNTFENYLNEVILMLKVREEVNNYGDLCRIAFSSKEDARRNLLKQLEFTNDSIKVVEQDPSILNLPVGKRILLTTLRKGYERTKKEFMESIEDTYG